jgi:hypothetical protein
MAVRQGRIFVPWETPFDGSTWAETLLGRVIRPLVDVHEGPKWFWFLRYVSHYPESLNCDIGQIPAERFYPQGVHRSIQFRFEIEDNQRERFERRGDELIAQAGCALSPWDDYGADELCSTRFLGPGRNGDRLLRRSLMTEYLFSVARLVLHGLKGPDPYGRYSPEQNTDKQNPHGSSYESMHHMFCNMTGVPTTVLVLSNGVQDFFTTHWGAAPEGFQLVTELPVVY